MAEQPFLASNSFAGDGTTLVWEFSFEGLASDSPVTSVPYIDPADVRAEFITGVGESQVTTPQAITLETGNSIRLETAPPVGTILRIYRVTENRFPLVNYQDLQSVGASDLDLANRQAVYIVQEALDAARGAGNVAAETLALVNGAAQAAAESAQEAADAAAEAEATVAGLRAGLAIENAAWMGFFSAWPMGFSRAVGTAEREQIPAGVTHGRAGFVAGTTIYHAGPRTMRVQRNAGDVSTANHTVCMNLSAAETAPLRGKVCTAHIYLRAGANYSGAGVTFRAQYSVEPEQPVLSSVAQYTNGHVVLASDTTLPPVAFDSEPVALTFTVPADATQVALALVIPWLGTAGAEDLIEAREAAIYVAPAQAAVRQADDAELRQKAGTRYQTSYPYGSSFGANSTQGSVSAVSRGSAVNWAVHADVRFNPRLVVPPRFQFAAPGTGIRSRWLSPTGTFLTGIAFDLSDSGVTVTNNAAAVADTRYLFQWAADALF